MAVALVASIMVWLFGGARGGLLVPVVPWLFVLLVEILFFFPQRRQGEMSLMARERVRRDLRKDPLTWLSFGFLVLLLIPFVNNGLCPICDHQRIAQGVDPNPPVPFIPFCVDRLDHLNVVLWFATALPAMLLVKHGLTRAGKRLVIEMIVWNGTAAAVLGFIQGATGAQGPYWTALPPSKNAVDFFSTFGYPNMGGDYFTTLFGLSLALWRHHVEVVRQDLKLKDVSHLAGNSRGLFWRKHYFLIPAVICFYAAINTLSRAAIILATLTAVIYFLHTFISFLSRLPRVRRVMIGAWSLLGLGLVVFFSLTFMPENLQREVGTLNSNEILTRVTGKGQYHVEIATEVWKDHKVFGCGGWGYLHFCVPKMVELKKDLSQLQVIGGINVHNDYLQFLAEHGIVGFGILVALVVLLVWPIGREWRKLARDTRFMKGRDLPPKPVQIFVLPAPVFFILVTVLATLIHAFGDCPLRSAAVLTLFFISLAAMPGFMPRRAHHGNGKV